MPRVFFITKAYSSEETIISKESYPMWRNSYQASFSLLLKSGEEAVPIEKYLSRDTGQQRLRFNHKIKEHSPQTTLPHQLDSSKQQRITNNKTERTRH